MKDNRNLLVDKVRELHLMGKSYKEIAEELEIVDEESVKNILQPVDVHLIEHIVANIKAEDVIICGSYEELLQYIWMLGKYGKNYTQIEPLTLKIW